MNQERQICPRCNNMQDIDFLLLNAEGNCYTCNGAGQLSEEHAQLFEYGFSEEVELGEDYSMYIHKVLNELETIEVDVKRVGGSMVIAKLGFKSPAANDYMSRIHTIGDLIDFLKS